MDLKSRQIYQFIRFYNSLIHFCRILGEWKNLTGLLDAHTHLLLLLTFRHSFGMSVTQLCFELLDRLLIYFPRKFTNLILIFTIRPQKYRFKINFVEYSAFDLDELSKFFAVKKIECSINQF